MALTPSTLGKYSAFARSCIYDRPVELLPVLDVSAIEPYRRLGPYEPSVADFYANALYEDPLNWPADATRQRRHPLDRARKDGSLRRESLSTLPAGEPLPRVIDQPAGSTLLYDAQRPLYQVVDGPREVAGPLGPEGGVRPRVLHPKEKVLGEIVAPGHRARGG